jgi:hypothetical protein
MCTYSISQREAACPLYLYRFPPEAGLEGRPFFAAPSGGGAADLFYVPRGCGAAAGAGAGCLLFLEDEPDAIRLPDGRKAPVCDFSAAGTPLPDPIRGWVRLGPVCASFPLPCPPGGGEALSRAALAERITGKAVFYAAPFGCMACVLPQPPARLLLFDTDETLRKKLLLAEARGAEGVFGCLSCGQA